MQIHDLPKETRKDWDALVNELKKYNIDASQKGIEAVNMFMAPCHLLLRLAVFWLFVATVIQLLAFFCGLIPTKDSKEEEDQMELVKNQA